jgi:hypothetical protein
MPQTLRRAGGSAQVLLRQRRRCRASRTTVFVDARRLLLVDAREELGTPTLMARPQRTHRVFQDAGCFGLPTRSQRTDVEYGKPWRRA